MPQARTDIFSRYEQTVARYMNARRDQIVVDVGGGRSCPFAKHKNRLANAKIIAVDVSPDGMKHNRDVDGKVVADVLKALPFENEKVDIVVSSSVLEHLERLEDFIATSSRILKTDGHFIHLFPSKFAPFALINQMLPKKLSRRLLYFFNPQSVGVCGFPSFYNKCYYSAMKPLLKKHGLEMVDVHCGYFQSPYFSFFIPFFVLSAVYEIILQAMGAKNLCAYLMVVARKKPV